jgi:methionyl-tRNA synthetase
MAAEQVLFLVAEGLRISGILLQAFLPDKSARMLDILGVREDNRTFDHAVLRCDPSYGVPMADPGRSREDALFPPLIEDMDVEFSGSVKNRKKATTKQEILQTEN